jgi:hypothetical protein
VDCSRPVLFHDDIHPGNIIVDNEYNLRGLPFLCLFQVLTSKIIDWDMVALVPLEAAIRLPTFLSKTPSPDQHGIVDDADRDLYIQGFRKCEVAKREITGAPLTSLLETSFYRAYFHEAFHSPSIHLKWFQEHSRKSAKWLLQELDDFCKINSSNLKGLEDEVIKLREAIERVNKMEKRQLRRRDADQNVNDGWTSIPSFTVSSGGNTIG